MGRSRHRRPSSRFLGTDPGGFMTTYAVHDPRTGTDVETYPTATDQDIQSALAAADHAHKTWARKATVEQRAARVARVAHLHRERKDELAEIIVREMGKPMEEAVGEVE